MIELWAAEAFVLRLLLLVLRKQLCAFLSLIFLCGMMPFPVVGVLPAHIKLAMRAAYFLRFTSLAYSTIPNVLPKRLLTCVRLECSTSMYMVHLIVTTARILTYSQLTCFFNLLSFREFEDCTA
jgi:hypothetical protein